MTVVIHEEIFYGSIYRAFTTTVSAKVTTVVSFMVLRLFQLQINSHYLLTNWNVLTKISNRSLTKTLQITAFHYKDRGFSKLLFLNN